MARSIGLPARLVMGYANGTYSYSSWQHDRRDAHSWVEIYFPGTGWVEFELTAGQPEPSAWCRAVNPQRPDILFSRNKFCACCRWPSATRWVLFSWLAYLGLVILFFPLAVEKARIGRARPLRCVDGSRSALPGREGIFAQVRSFPGQTASEFAENPQTRAQKA